MARFFRRRRDAKYVEPPPDEEATRVIRRVEDEPPTAGPPPPGPPLSPPEESPAERNLWPWLLVLLALVLGGIGLAYFLSRDDDEPEVVPVEAVVNLELPEARQVLRDAGFTVVVRQRFSERPPGTVLDQQPPGGSELERGGTVTLIASRGTATVEVPNLRGLSEAAAAVQLSRTGLEASVFRVPSSEPVGTVVAQNPRAGEQVDRGSSVRVNVSRGAGTTTGTTATDTTATETTPTETTPTTTGTTTPTGTTAAPQPPPPPPPTPVDVPDVVGQSETAAAAALASVDLLADSYPVAASETPGTVVAQRPVSGATANTGTAVRLNVAIGTGTRPANTVPDVTGVNERVARSRLRRVAFTVRGIPRLVSETGQNGVVILQRPAAGESLPARTQITIYVGKLR